MLLLLKSDVYMFYFIIFSNKTNLRLKSGFKRRNTEINIHNLEKKNRIILKKYLSIFEKFENRTNCKEYNLL